ncbi:hypothetical protein TL16_g04005 [Triparma laevis f. inornata]|uniref:ATP-dependent DNA ligase family profile domain-containing protein n=1 Tax=Triparma laevis f. inornata TaxID=1714386 RepID=A0A9W7A732_9STRA|nr:hypothetical protein TL16_g04005 [Triparma laevis f. inornata]
MARKTSDTFTGVPPRWMESQEDFEIGFPLSQPGTPPKGNKALGQIAEQDETYSQPMDTENQNKQNYNPDSPFPDSSSSQYVIFCDLDGTLVDFDAGRRKFGIFDSNNSSNMWDAINNAPNFFASLDFLPDGKQLWDHIAPFSPNILTGVPQGGWAAKQKQAWCRTHLDMMEQSIHPWVDLSVDKDDPRQSQAINGNMILTCWSRFKHLLSGPGCVLIDDRSDLRTEWERAGGIFIHHVNAETTISHLKALNISASENPLNNPSQPFSPLSPSTITTTTGTVAMDQAVARMNSGDKPLKLSADEARAIMDDKYKAKESDFKKANQLKFSDLIERLEAVELNRTHIPSKDELLRYILPVELWNHLKPGGSAFPYLRLLMPQIDNGRPGHYGMKEAQIADMWGAAMGLDSESEDQQRLKCYKDPTKTGFSAKGNLANAIQDELKKRNSEAWSSISLETVNAILDELCYINKNLEFPTGSTRPHTSSGVGLDVSSYDVARQSKNTQVGGKEKPKQPKNPYVKEPRKPSRKERRIKWCRELSEKYGLSPVEQKWLVRVIMGKLELGCNYKSILRNLHPDMINMYSSVQNLAIVCAQLADERYMLGRKIRQKAISLLENERLVSGAFSAMSWQQTDTVEVGTAFPPMLSDKTNFENLIEAIQKRVHNNPNILKTSAGATATEYKAKIQSLPLPLKHPPMIGEVKLDGERMLFHCNRGKITCHTRRNKWYSARYCPVLGPQIRKAIGDRDIKVIFDGEVLSWDNAKGEVIPFGLNRQVAKIRAEYLQTSGDLDRRDADFSAQLKTGNLKNIVGVGDGMSFDKRNSVMDKRAKDGEVTEKTPGAGAFLWLTYIIFDIVYIGGPGAKDLLKEIGLRDTELFLNSQTSDEEYGGSIMHLDLSIRKQILYHLVTPVLTHVEIACGVVITCDGRTEKADDFFKHGGHKGYVERRNLNRKSDEEEDEKIEQKRARAIDKFYTTTVENHGEEGLLVKELLSPYLLGTALTRSKAFWRKIKPDYGAENAASDIDVIVLGAYFADGQTRRGMITSYMVGLADDEKDFNGEQKYLTLVKVSGAKFEEYRAAQRYTGYLQNKETKVYDLGKWTPSGIDRTKVPDFISKRSFQRTAVGDDKGWFSSSKNEWPDLWIRPEDSFVLTIKAAEVVSSVQHSAGFTLRFPRIVKMRIDIDDQVGDEKPTHLCEAISNLKQIYAEKKNAEKTKDSSREECRFLTATENNKLKATLRRQQKPGRVRAAVKEISKTSAVASHLDIKVRSKIFEGKTFCVLSGCYRLDQKSVDAEQAKVGGYFEKMLKVNDKQHVERFLIQHGGVCVLESLGVGREDITLIGGESYDPKIVNILDALERGTSKLEANKTATVGSKLSKKKKETLENLVNVKVLRWTWCFAAVGALWGKEGEELPEPRSFEYLVLSEYEREKIKEDEDDFGIRVGEDYDVLRLKRAFENMAKGSGGGSSGGGRWQEDERLFDDEKWVLGGLQSELWPFSTTGSTKTESSKMYLFPSYNVSDSVGSNVPAGALLARAMGAVLQEKLQDNTTHVLVDELLTYVSLKWNAVKRGKALMEAYGETSWWGALSEVRSGE